MQAARRAQKKGIPCDLLNHLSEIEARMQCGRCELTGLPFNFDSKHPSWNSPSLHRKNPSGGYIYENIQVICFGMNAALGSWGEAALRNMLAAWLEKGR